MNRRNTIKTILAGTVATGLTAAGCKTEPGEEVKAPLSDYRAKVSEKGQTPEEKERDAKLFAEGNFFTEHEAATIAVLADIIVPEDETGPKATDTGVVEFIDFMMWDLPDNQDPMRGGLKWLDYHCAMNHDAAFINLPLEKQTAVLDLIAYPDDTLPEHKHGEKFFSLIRNMVMTGYFTSKAGTADVGYAGNFANFWDGVPDEVLKKHGLEYDARTLEICIKAEDRETMATWDEEGNLLT
ncbi:MAG: gluconate 2-dehydrogenase gamma chain [Saprospiraceae bacterium]|jgi:gluconate 2-dehydrogenase gamma chain